MNRPFDAARYAGLLEGLEATEIRLVEVRTNNEKLRIDSGYFAKPMLAAERSIRAYANGYDELGGLFSRFIKGIFDINADAYVDVGVPFLRILNLRNGVIDDNDIAMIPETVHRAEIKTELHRRDIVLSKTAYPAASLVTLDRCNTSQDTIATTLSDYGTEHYTPEALVAYLNSDLGKRLLWRQFQGNVQLHLSLSDGRKIPVPKLPLSVQHAITQAFRQVETLQARAHSCRWASENFLLDALDLKNWQPPEPLSYVSSNRDALAARRLDAEYFSPATRAILDVLGKKGDVALGDLCRVTTGYPWQSDQFIEHGAGDGIPFVRIRDCKPGAIWSDDLDRLDNSYAVAQGQPQAKLGDLVVGMDGLKWFYASLLMNDAYINQRVAWLIPADTGYPGEYLLTVINSMIGQRQLLSRMTIAHTVGHITLEDMRGLRIPRLDEAMRQAIAELTRDAITCRQQATQLLDAARRAVEIAIEDSEAAALQYLAR